MQCSQVGKPRRDPPHSLVPLLSWLHLLTHLLLSRFY